MHLDPRGNVRACELNSMKMLGNITQSSLLEIWQGRPVAALRDALAADDLSLGCEGCAWQVRAGDAHLAHARQYDHFGLPDPGGDGDAVAWPRQLELSLTNTCNLQCVQCSGELSSAIRAQREHRPPLPQVYGEAFFAELARLLPHVERLVMIGGEPFLGRESLRVFDMLIDAGLTPGCQVSTNGTVWNDKVERILEHLPVDVSVSMDGSTPELYRSIRVGAELDATLANLDRFQAYAARRGTNLNLNFCLMQQNSLDFADFLLMSERRGLPTPVHVLTVTHPAHFSLFRLPAGPLAELIGQMERQERERLGELVLNRHVWDDELARLRHHLAVIEQAGVPVRVSGQASARVAQAVAEQAGGGGPLHTIDTFDSELVTAIGPDPSDVLGMDLRPLVGEHIGGIMGLLTDRFGEVVGTDLEHLGDGVEQRTMVFDRDGVATTLYLVLATEVAERTDRWYLALAPDPAAATVPGRP